MVNNNKLITIDIIAGSAYNFDTPNIGFFKKKEVYPEQFISNYVDFSICVELCPYKNKSSFQ